MRSFVWQGILGCGAHTDWGVMTLLVMDSPGLQIHRGGAWQVRSKRRPQCYPDPDPNSRHNLHPNHDPNRVSGRQMVEICQWPCRRWLIRAFLTAADVCTIGAGRAAASRLLCGEPRRSAGALDARDVRVDTAPGAPGSQEMSLLSSICKFGVALSDCQAAKRPSWMHRKHRYCI